MNLVTLGKTGGPVELCKFDDDAGIVYGYAIVCKVLDAASGEWVDYYDRQGDHITEAAIVQAGQAFAKNGKGMLMHKGAPIADIAFVMPETVAMIKAAGSNATVSGLKIGWKPYSAEVYKAVKDGTYPAFSVGADSEDYDYVDGEPPE